MLSIYGVIIITHVFIQQLMTSSAHPMCLDYFPPFSLGEGGVFCNEYQSFGCCTIEKNKELEVKLNSILKQVEETGLSTVCSGYLKDTICQECSPYSAQLFAVDTEQEKRPLPGLCKKYCTDFHNTCKDTIKLLTQDRHILSNSQSPESFCGAVSLKDNSYCYPDLLQNTNLNKQLQRETSSEDDCLCVREFTRGLKKPIILTSPNDDTNRIFIGTQYGKVYVYYENGTRLQDAFLDIVDIVHITSSRQSEVGLLGLVFHPNYAQNQKLYVHYVMKNSKGSFISRISEFRVIKENKNKVDQQSIKKIIDIDQPFSQHNAGQLLFGSDGYLYIFLGDGGSQGDPMNTAQNRDNLLGSLLRINVDTNDQQGYTIPADNPFINIPNARPEIYAYGFANPHGADEDEGDPETGFGKGRLFAGDVGHRTWEEINRITRGGNYGWSVKEGAQCFKEDLCKTLVSDIAPIYSYNHSAGQVVVGGRVYRGCLNPNLNGLYIYGDYFNGKLFRLKETFQGSNSWENKEIKMCSDSICNNGLTNKYTHNILGFGEDYNGEVYIIATSGAREDSGTVYQIVDPRRRGDPETCRNNKKNKKVISQIPVTEMKSTPTWPFWMMAIVSMISFKSGLLCMYGHYRIFPRWRTYRRLVNVNTVHHRNNITRSSEQDLTTCTNTDQGL